MEIKIKGKRDISKEYSCIELKREYITNPTMVTGDKYNTLQRCISSENRLASLDEELDIPQYLYPTMDDGNFNTKIASKKEFYDNRYEEHTDEDFQNIKNIAQRLCDNTEFELAPHQMFVKNFMSFETPYNGLLLYHGLGTGKTCSAISVCEEMRTYLKKMGNLKKIIIVASPSVQENFKTQLFNENKLKLVNGLWNIKACTGNNFIKEINPMNMKGLDRERVIKQIKRIIRHAYDFKGYVEFSNHIEQVMNKKVLKTDDDDTIQRKQARALNKEFSNRMLVIDEVHNLRVTDKGKVKPSSNNILNLAKYSDNLKILILSATPMFNSYLEIIWLTNLLNANDKRYIIRENEIFDNNGNFVQDDTGNEIGKELLIQKITGYVSYVRGNNPFSFPYSIYPKESNSEHSLLRLMESGKWKYPETQLNGAAIVAPINLLDLTMLQIGDYQFDGYNYILEAIKEKYPVLNNPNKGIPYTALDSLRQALNIIYPHKEMSPNNDEKDTRLHSYLYGKKGLARTMLFNERTISDFKYKKNTLDDFERIFAFENIGKYSSKIKYICESIMKSKGIIFVYSEYIYGGVIPIALALEELGFTRYGKSKSLFETPPTLPIDGITMERKDPNKAKSFKAAKYMMITGDKSISHNIKTDLNAITSDDNINGENIKVVIVSRAGSEGLDFKNIREMHILDSWYNLNRQEQIIGRAVRNLSHCSLPFEERNVSIFLYGTILPDEIESVDLYIYRLAEDKARKMAIISRILKENAVDCLLNNGQDFTVDTINKNVELILSSRKKINYNIGDKNGSIICDFTNCKYDCNTKSQTIDEIDESTYNESFITMNLDKIIQRIRILYKEKYIFEKSVLIAAISHIKRYPLDQIYSALDYLINDNNEYITDMFGRLGKLVNIGNYYLYQPVELIDNKYVSYYERSHPINFKREKLTYRLSDKIKEYDIQNEVKGDDVGYKSVIFNKMVNYYKELETPHNIGVEDREHWIKNAAWVIYNLHEWQGIDELMLITLAFEHIIEVMSLKDKKELLNYITHPSTPESNVYIIIKTIFEKFEVKNDNMTGIVLSDGGNTPPYVVLILNGDKYEENEKSDELEIEINRKFRLTSHGVINDMIGFMGLDNQTIVFKTKSMFLSEKKRVIRGHMCPKGQTKSTIIKKLNSISPPSIIPGAHTIKYKILKTNIESIFGNKNNESPKNSSKAFFIKTDSAKAKINATHLCIETELILRYSDITNRDDKRWFFNSIESHKSNIKELSNMKTIITKHQ